MRIIHGLETVTHPLPRSVVAIGKFDGVHRGHQAVLGRTVHVGRERGLRPVAVTFDRHPREILTPGKEPPLLTSLERKADLIGVLGIEVLVVLEFDEDFSRWPPEDFVDRVLVSGLHAEHAMIGSNFTFGYKAAGTLAMLSGLGPARGFTVEGVSLLRIGGRVVSSSSIREALAAGDLAWPTEALGRRFVLDGTVIPAQLGPERRRLGEPQGAAPHADSCRRGVCGQGLRRARGARGCDQRRHQSHLRGRTPPRRGAPPRFPG